MKVIVYRTIDNLIVQTFNTHIMPTVIPEGCVAKEIDSELPDLTKNEAHFNVETNEISLSPLEQHNSDKEFIAALQIRLSDIWVEIDTKQQLLDAYKYDIEQSILFDITRDDIEDKKAICRELVSELKTLKAQALEITNEMNSSI